MPRTSAAAKAAAAAEAEAAENAENAENAAEVEVAADASSPSLVVTSAVAPVESAVLAEVQPLDPAPAAAALAAPEPKIKDDGEKPSLPQVSDAGVAMTVLASGQILDAATGEAPADLDAVFEAPTAGNVFTVKVRLLERFASSANHESTITRLLLPIGARVAGFQAEAILDRLRKQA